MDTRAIRFDLDDRHLDTWRDDVCDQLLDADTSMTSSSALGVNLGITAIAGIVHLDCRTTERGLQLGRDAKRVARTNVEAMGLSVVMSGEAEVETRSGTHVLHAGELCLLSSAEVFSKRLSASYQEQFLYLPVPLALALGRKAPVMRQRLIVAQRHGLGALLADTVTSMARMRNDLTANQWSTALGAIFEITTGVFGEPQAEAMATSSRHAQHARALRYIEAHLAEPTLSPRQIAAALGMSLRYLHLLFEDGPSVGATMLASRLDRCRDALVDPAFRHRSVSEIAYQWGFNDAAHFSRTFKTRFGVSPRAVRHHGNRAPGGVPG